MKRRALIAAALATLVAASLAASASADPQAGARSEAAAVSCKGTINIGNLTVLTGPAAFLGILDDQLDPVPAVPIVAAEMAGKMERPPLAFA